MNCRLTDASATSGRWADFSRELKTHQTRQMRISAHNTSFIRPILLWLWIRFLRKEAMSQAVPSICTPLFREKETIECFLSDFSELSL